VPIVDLYVEGDNAPALKVYRNLGFQDHKKDVLYTAATAPTAAHSHDHD
jgi:mycothiol synthase